MTTNLGTVTLDWEDANALLEAARERRYELLDQARSDRRTAEGMQTPAAIASLRTLAERAEAEADAIATVLDRVNKALR